MLLLLRYLWSISGVVTTMYSRDVTRTREEFSPRIHQPLPIAILRPPNHIILILYRRFHAMSRFIPPRRSTEPSAFDRWLEQRLLDAWGEDFREGVLLLDPPEDLYVRPSPMNQTWTDEGISAPSRPLGTMGTMTTMTTTPPTSKNTPCGGIFGPPACMTASTSSATRCPNRVSWTPRLTHHPPNRSERIPIGTSSAHSWNRR